VPVFAGILVFLRDKKIQRERHFAGATYNEQDATGTGVVSHTGTVLLAELADRIGLTAALSEATDSLRNAGPGTTRAGCWSM